MPILEKRSTAEAVVEHFKSAIQSGKFRPGDALPSERILQKQLEISRFSLREGLARLSALGLIKIIHGKGAFVSDGTNQQSLNDVFIPMIAEQGGDMLTQLLEARRILESELAILASVKRGEEHLLRLEMNLKAGESAIADQDVFAEVDLEYHQIIAEATGNAFLLKMHQVLWGHLKGYLKDFAAKRSNRKVAWQTHVEIYEAIKTQDEERVRNLMLQHLEESQRAFSHSKTS